NAGLQLRRRGEGRRRCDGEGRGARQEGARAVSDPARPREEGPGGDQGQVAGGSVTVASSLALRLLLVWGAKLARSAQVEHLGQMLSPVGQLDLGDKFHPSDDLLNPRKGLQDLVSTLTPIRVRLVGQEAGMSHGGRPSAGMLVPIGHRPMTSRAEYP